MPMPVTTEIEEENGVKVWKELRKYGNAWRNLFIRQRPLLNL
jgi:hypothetical protein